MCVTIKGIEVDLEKLIDFEIRATKKQADGNDRILWFDEKESSFFETCETKNTDYNLDNCVCIDFVEGDNNSTGLKFICDGCNGCIDEFMTDKKINNMKYHEFNKFMTDLYYNHDKSNDYNISIDEIKQYREDYTCSWYCDFIEDCCYDYFEKQILKESI